MQPARISLIKLTVGLAALAISFAHGDVCIAVGAIYLRIYNLMENYFIFDYHFFSGLQQRFNAAFRFCV